MAFARCVGGEGDLEWESKNRKPRRFGQVESVEYPPFQTLRNFFLFYPYSTGREGKLHDPPHILRGVAHLTARHRRRERVITHTNLLIHPRIREIILPLCHRADGDAQALFLAQPANVLAHIDDRRLPRQRDLSAV